MARTGCSVLLSHLSDILRSSIHTRTSSNYSKLHAKGPLPCQKGGLESGDGLCLMNWSPGHCKKGCGKDHVSIAVTRSEIGLNQTESAPCGEGDRHTSMLDSSVLVAGVVIGVVLFLSCVAIILGSLRKNRCFRHLHLQRDDSYPPDCFSSGGSAGERRSSCTEEPPPSFYFSPSMEALSRVNLTHPDSPPRYDECVGDQAAQACIPTDDPPPYSLIDPCRQNEQTLNVPWDEELSPGTSMERDAGYLSGPRDLQEPIPSVSLSSSFPMEAAPPYETVVCEQNMPIPLVPLDVLKNSTNYYQNFVSRTI